MILLNILYLILYFLDHAPFGQNNIIDLWIKWNETRITLNDENLHNETYREANPWKKCQI